MKSNNRLWIGIISASVMFLLILDSKTALTGAKEGVTLCLYTVIPSLFPFLIISLLLGSVTVGIKSPILRPLGRLCGIPEGAESLLILGLIGGYPVGAQNITQAYHNGQIKKEDAHRLLGFCNNAGPAFIFGLVSSLFHSPTAPWAIWIIHIASALIVGCILPKKSRESCCLPKGKPVTFSKAVESCIKIMSGICGWVIVFRVFLAILQHWLFWALPKELSVLLYGFTELSNGCIELFNLNSQGTRFILSAVFLSFGGLCVMMQTVSVTKDLGIGIYIPGKILQTLISLLLAGATQALLLPAEEQFHISSPAILSVICICVSISLWLYRRKKVLAIPSIV